MAMLTHVGRYGAPYRLLSDNGSQYVNELISELTRLIGIEHNTSLAYSHEENAIVERENKEVLRHLRALIFDTNIMTELWKYVPIIQRILNSTVHSRTGATPSQLVFGNSCNLTRGIFHTKEQVEKIHLNGIPLSKWASDMLTKQAQLIKVAQLLQEGHDVQHVTAVATKNNNEITTFPVNSFVLTEYPRTAFGAVPPSKLLTRLKGPFRVVSISSDGNHYTLTNLATNKEENVHLTRIRPFVTDENIDPSTVANKDQQLFDVEAIVQHKGSQKLKSQMKFKVKWLGYDDSQNSWSPWKDLAHNAVQHQYLRAHGMAALVPSRYKSA
jgi:hypothetical protein